LCCRPIQENSNLELLGKIDPKSKEAKEDNVTHSNSKNPFPDDFAFIVK